MYIADMHCDTLTTVNAEKGLINDYNVSKIHRSLQLFAAFVPFSGRSAEERRRELMRLSNIYLYETERLGLARISDVRDLILAEDEGRSSAMLTVEGGAGLLADSEELFTLHKAGLRVMGLAWDTNELATGAYDETDTGLTYEGRRMVERLAELGITPDVSHLSDQSFYDLIECTPLPVIATHSNFRKICQSKRNLTLDMAKIITARGGVIGLNLYPKFLTDKSQATADDILRHVDFALENLGESAIGFGCDIDGTDGLYPNGFSEGESIHDKLIDTLLRHYPVSTVERIAGQNVIDFFKGTL
jgi:membrane dipeptidase